MDYRYIGIAVATLIAYAGCQSSGSEVRQIVFDQEADTVKNYDCIMGPLVIPETGEAVAYLPFDPDRVYNMHTVEQRPEFPGGDAFMYEEWISQQIIYPEEAAAVGAQGKVVIQFEIMKDGVLDNIRVVRSLHPALDAEALRIVKSMPRWEPGRVNDQPVIVTYILPVSFKLP